MMFNKLDSAFSLPGAAAASPLKRSARPVHRPLPVSCRLPPRVVSSTLGALPPVNATR